ncbi:MAG: hypothetical protein NT052_00365 [Candidatus Shapirobacteria bacterium]|nr:hypothetical protein [Candidatus Shapirobacteria bacterium]
MEMKTTPILQLPLELAVVEWCEDETGKTSATPIKEKPIEEKKEMKTNPYSESQENLPRESLDKNSVDSQEPSKKVIEFVEGDGNGDGNLQAIISKWGDLLEGVKPLNHSVEALLKAARPLKMDKGFLVLEVFYKFHKERLDSDKCRSIVEEVASQLLGNQIKIKCILGQKKKEAVSEQEKDDIMEVASEIFNGKLVD